jgi:hypothetical protein
MTSGLVNLKVAKKPLRHTTEISEGEVPLRQCCYERPSMVTPRQPGVVIQYFAAAVLVPKIDARSIAEGTMPFIGTFFRRQFTLINN